MLCFVITDCVPVPEAARSKAKVNGRSPAAIMGSNPTGSVDVCLLCVLLGRGLCDKLITRQDESYRLGASLCVIKKPRGRGGHSPCWAAGPEMVMMMMMIIMDCVMIEVMNCIAVELQFDSFCLSYV
jgi:hypothetical protein